MGALLLYRKTLADSVCVVPCNDPMLSAVKRCTQHGPVLVLGVYMPTDYHDDNSVDRYMETCGKIDAVITDCDVAETVIIGDFNCQAGWRLYNSFTNLLTANKLVCSDGNMLKDAYTYNNSDCSCISWIDHILCTNSLNSAISEIRVLCEFILSDHKPISVNFCELLSST